MTTPLFVVLAATLSGAAPNSPSLDVRHAWIALEAEGARPGDREVRARLGEDVSGWLVLEGREGRHRRIWSGAPTLRKRGRRVRARPWPADVPIEITWFKLEADPLRNGIYDNTGKLERAWHPIARADHPRKWHWCPIDTVESETGWGSVWSHALDARPTTTPDDYGGLGTMRFVARVRVGDKELWTPGHGVADKSGYHAGAATVRFRADDTPVGYMTELLNVPYVYGSSSPNGTIRAHQTERAVGADCADLVVYGWRRAGSRQDYTWTGGLVGRTRLRARVQSVLNGVYRDGDGKPLRFGHEIAVGDILLWKGHVAVIAKKDPSGVLTRHTSMIHTVVESAAIEPLGQLGFGFDQPPFEIRRKR